MTVTVTPTVEASNMPPRIRLDVSASAGETSTTVQRLNPDGTLVTVRTNDGNPLPISAGTALVYDYEPPFSQVVQYSSLESPATVSAGVTLAVSSVWLIHPGVPSLSMPVTIGEISERKRAVRRAVVQPMGRRNAWTASDGQRKGPEYTLTVYAPDDDTRADLDDLLDDTSVLLLNIPLDKGWGVTWEYVSVGDVTERRVTRFIGAPQRMVDLPLIVVDRPVGGSQAQRVWTDVPTAYASWNAVKAHYVSWAAVLAGP